jgi:hypothetical protein
MNNSSQHSGSEMNQRQDSTSSARIGSNNAFMDACNSVARTYNHMSTTQKALGAGLLVGAAVVAGAMATGFNWSGIRSYAAGGNRKSQAGNTNRNK